MVPKLAVAAAGVSPSTSAALPAGAAAASVLIAQSC